MLELAAKAAKRAELFVRNRVTPINRRPLIFLGKGKSGTTAITALFAVATGKTGALDIRGLYIDGLRPILQGKSHLGSVIKTQRVAFSKDILKQPTLTWLYDELRKCFPEARFVMIIRDPRDNIRSVFNRMGIDGDLEDLNPEQVRDIHPGWRWHFAEPELLGLTGPNYIELSANRWNKAADVYLRHADEMLLIRYEDFVADRVSAIESLAARLGYPVVRDIGPHANRQYQRLGKDRGRPWVEFFGSRNLATIEQVCGERMRQLGYEASGSATAGADRASSSTSR